MAGKLLKVYLLIKIGLDLGLKARFLGEKKLEKLLGFPSTVDLMNVSSPFFPTDFEFQMIRHNQV